MNKNWLIIIAFLAIHPICKASSPIDAYNFPYAVPALSSTAVSLAMSKALFMKTEEQALTQNDDIPPETGMPPLEITAKTGPKITAALESAWQDIFYTCHHGGKQNFLFLMHDQTLLEEFTYALGRLAKPEMPSLQRVQLMVAAPSQQHEALTFYFKTHVFFSKKYVTAFETRNLHFCSNRFFEDPKSNSLKSVALNNEKYTCIFTQAEFVSKVIPLLHISTGVLYISYEADKDWIMLLLKAENFKERNIMVGDKIICAMRSDPRDYIRSSLRPAFVAGRPNRIAFEAKSAENKYLKSLPTTPCHAHNCNVSPNLKNH